MVIGQVRAVKTHREMVDGMKQMFMEGNLSKNVLEKLAP